MQTIEKLYKFNCKRFSNYPAICNCAVCKCILPNYKAMLDINVLFITQFTYVKDCQIVSRLCYVCLLNL